MTKIKGHAMNHENARSINLNPDFRQNLFDDDYDVLVSITNTAPSIDRYTNTMKESVSRVTGIDTDYLTVLRNAEKSINNFSENLRILKKNASQQPHLVAKIRQTENLIKNLKSKIELLKQNENVRNALDADSNIDKVALLMRNQIGYALDYMYSVEEK